jgi:hypothetical protein
MYSAPRGAPRYELVAGSGSHVAFEKSIWKRRSPLGEGDEDLVERRLANLVAPFTCSSSPARRRGDDFGYNASSDQYGPRGAAECRAWGELDAHSRFCLVAERPKEAKPGGRGGHECHGRRDF